MTVQEYIEKDLPFYYITPFQNKDSILKNGIKPCSFGAICVVRSDDEEIWEDIIATQLSKLDKNIEFAIIKLIPSIHRIQAIDIAPDDVIDPTNDLHNYIVGKTIQIIETDIVKTIFTDDAKSKEIPDSKKEKLTGYLRGDKMSGFMIK